MTLFFLLLAVFSSSAQVEDTGPFGNYTGICSLRPMEYNPDRNAIMCFPNKQKIMEIDDFVLISGHTTRNQDSWAINLLSSTYQVLFQIRFENGNTILRSNMSPWGQRESIWNVQSTFATPFKNGERFVVKLHNRVNDLAITIQTWNTYTFRHVADPTRAYKYLSITKPSSDDVHIEYHTYLHGPDFGVEVIPISKGIWRP